VRAPTDWWKSVTIDLENEPSGVASCAFEAAPLTIYDVESSPRVSRRLAERVGGKSAAFVPLISSDRVIAVLAAATTRHRRHFPANEILLLEALAAESALALERARSAVQLEGARRSADRGDRAEGPLRARHRRGHTRRCGRTGKALGLTRCFIGSGTRARRRRSALSGTLRAPAIAENAPDLPVTNLSLRERGRAVADDRCAELADPALGRVETLLDLDTGRPGRSNPRLRPHDRRLRSPSQPGAAVVADRDLLAEAVSRESASRSTPRDCSKRIKSGSTGRPRLQAAQVMTSELRVETVASAWSSR
jgi:hypothetical protein